MLRDWKFPQPEVVPSEILEMVGGHSLLSSLLVRRKISNPSQARAFLNPEDYIPACPEELPGMGQAIDCILNAIQKGQRICIWGDFDVDGQTSTALLVQALTGLGGNVSYYIPIRARESHGVNITSLERIIQNGVELVVTCDTGISAHAEVAYARQQGVEVVITDHHELPGSLPDAAAIINPHFLNEEHPLAPLPGVGVAYKLAEGLYNASGRQEETDQFLDLVVLGIIADVALLTKDNRYYAQRGMQMLRQTQRLGLQNLFELAELKPAGITEEHIGFIIGPRLNALGRLSDANKAVDFLTTTSQLTARLLAIELEGLNAQRQLMTTQVYQAALSMIERDPSLLDGYSLVLGYPTWPAGVIGIVASRLVEQFGKPVVLLSTPPGEPTRGSARSVEGVDIIAAITTQKEYLEHFGGHKMAAGLSMAPQHLERFRNGLSKAICEQTDGGVPLKPLMIDAEVGLQEVTLELVGDLERLAPFGAGNPQPVFLARDVHIESKSTFGRSGEHLTLVVGDSNGTTRSVVWWQGGSLVLPEEKFDLAFSLHASTYHGQPAVQMQWIDARLQQTELAIQINPRKQEWVDFRDVTDISAQLANLRTLYPDLMVWAEGKNKPHFDGKDRFEITPSSYLVIVTVPPSRAEIELVTGIVQPEVIFFLSSDPESDTFDKLLHRLAGLVNFSINNYKGLINLDRMAAACAQKQEVVKAGLQCLAARGLIQVIQKDKSTFFVSPGDKNPKANLTADDQRLKTYLAETKAFRRYYQHADLSGLL